MCNLIFYYSSGLEKLSLSGYNHRQMVEKYSSYIIAGPTASGKSKYAHELARKVNGVIINCDSVQIYRGIENISASPFAGRQIEDNIDGVPYRLFSILPLSTQISVADYLDMARKEYEKAVAAGFVPIFVGGTGYYINAIVQGISPIPEVSEINRARARELVASDIVSARKLLPKEFKATDPQRVARALEVFFETGRHMTDWQNLPRSGAITPTPYKILINPEMEELRPRIAARIPKMLSGGALDEARLIVASGWDPKRAIGAAQLCALVQGKVSKEQCIENWITKTNQYAKRQRTWFRTQFAADEVITNAIK